MKSKNVFLLAGFLGSITVMGPVTAWSATVSKKPNVASMNAPAGWSSGVVPGSADVAAFNYVTNAAMTFTLDNDLSLYALTFGWVPYMPVTFSGASTLTLGAGGMVQVDLVENSPVVFNHGLQLGASQSWIWFNTAQVYLNGNLSGAEDVTVVQASPRSWVAKDRCYLYLTASNTFAGTIEVDSGILRLNSATGSLNAATVKVDVNGQFHIYSPAGIVPAAGARGNRLTLNGGKTILTNSAPADLDERFSGALTLAPGLGEISCSPLPLYGTRLSFSGLEREAGGGVLFAHGNNIGENTFPAANVANILFDTPPLIFGGGGAYGSTTMSIIPYALCNDSNTGGPENFATYEAGYGLRQVTSYGSAIASGSVSDTNVHLTSTATIGAPATINALKLGSNGKVEGPGELTIGSGAILVVANSSIGASTPGTLAFGGREGIVSMDSTRTLSIGSMVTGTKGLTKTSRGSLTLSGPVDVGDAVTFYNDTLTFGNRVKAAVDVRSATLNLLPGSSVTGAVGSVGSTVNLQSGSAVEGALSASAGSTVNLFSGSVFTGRVYSSASTVNLQSGSRLQGSVCASNTSTVTLQPGSCVQGSLCASNTSVVTLQSNSLVNGSVLLAGSGSKASLLFGSAVTGTLYSSGTPVYMTNACTVAGFLQVDANGTVYVANGGRVEGAVTVGSGTLNLSSGAALNGSVFNQGTLNLSSGAALNGNVINQGTFELSGGATLSGIITNQSTFNCNGAGTCVLDVSFDGSGGFYQKSTAGQFTLRQAAGQHSIGQLVPSSGATLVLDGAPDAYTTVNSLLNPAGATYAFEGGTWAFNLADQQCAANIRLGGGTATATPNSQRFALGCANGSTLEISGGQLYIPYSVSWGLRLGNIHGAWNDTGYNFAGTQTGGEVIGWGGSGIEIGSSTLNKTCSYDLSGGTFASYRGDIVLGAATPQGNTSSTTFTLRDNGTLICSGTLRGEYWSTDRTYAQQIFAFKGGTLTARAYEAVNLRPAVGAARGALFNEGGTLAPGTLGKPGLTAISGSYTSAPNAVIAVDIGGTSQANAFTNVMSFYDTVQVSSNAVLDGALHVSAINGFAPAAGNTFDVLTCTTADTTLSGGFTNVQDGKVWTTDGFGRFDAAVDAANRRVRLSGFALNQWAGTAGGDWDGDNAWSLTNPATAAFGAYFGTNLAAAGTVTVGAPRALRGLTFNSAASYTLAGAGQLTLASGGADGMPRIQSLQGSHTVGTALALADALTVDVAGAAGTSTVCLLYTSPSPRD